jgi:hypothetical protein
METQTVALLLCLAALAAAGLCVRALAWFLYSGLLSPGSSWPVLRVYPVIQVHTATWQPIGLQLVLGQGAVVAVRSANVDCRMIDAHADPDVLPVPSFQDDVTL